MPERRTFWSGRKVLVTGASGLVGSHLVAELLSNGALVSAFVRDHDTRSELFRSGNIARVAIVHGALEELGDLERAVAESECAVVFHLAAQTIVGVGVSDPVLTFESNVRGTYNLLEACRRHASIIERIVVASSDKAYGPSNRPYQEDDPLRARSPYDVSKSAADLIAQSYHNTYQVPLAIVRCGNTYGGGDFNWSRIVPGTIRSFYFQQTPQIRSDGTFVRDYIYVADVIAAYLDVAEALDRQDVIGQAFNFASGAQYAVLEIVKAIAELMGGPLPEPRILNVARNEIKEQRLSIDKARRILGWAPQVALRDGLRETITWYRDYFGATA
jgi:CDP-glucose 4,6-dehydratase